MVYLKLCFRTSFQLTAPNLFYEPFGCVMIYWNLCLHTSFQLIALKMFRLCDNLLEFMFLHFISTYCTLAVSESFGYVLLGYVFVL